MRVTKNLDKVADVTNAAARLLGFIEERMPDSVLKNLSLSTELIVGSVAHLREAIRAMSSNDMARALQECEEIDRIEHEADEQKRAFIESIVRARLDATGVVLSFKLAETLEGVTDRVENVSDLIKLLVVKSR